MNSLLKLTRGCNQRVLPTCSPDSEDGLGRVTKARHRASLGKGALLLAAPDVSRTRGYDVDTFGVSGAIARDEVQPDLYGPHSINELNRWNEYGAVICLPL